MPTLSQILRTKLIPWSQQNASEHFIVARPQMRQADMPYGVQLIPHKIQSRRVLVKNKRCYDNVRNIIAAWPAEHLQELGKNTLVCVLDGHVDYPVGDYHIRCGAGNFIFIPQGIPVPDAERLYIDTEKSTFCEIITFLQHPGALECWQSRCMGATKTRAANYLLTHERLNAIFNALLQEIFVDDSSALRISAGLLLVFFRMLQREIDQENFQRIRDEDAKGYFKIASSNTTPVSFQTCLEHYIEVNLRQPLNLEKVARDMYLSPAQFTRNVRAATGKSFHQLLSEARLQEAKKLLQNSDWAIFSIAGLTGFRSANYFCDFFKRCTGQTPSEFRHEATKIKKIDNRSE